MIGDWDWGAVVVVVVVIGVVVDDWGMIGEDRGGIGWMGFD